MLAAICKEKALQRACVNLNSCFCKADTRLHSVWTCARPHTVSVLHSVDHVTSTGPIYELEEGLYLRWLSASQMAAGDHKSK